MLAVNGEASGIYKSDGIGAGTYSTSNPGTLTIGTGVTIQVKDAEEDPWADYVVDVRHKFMKAE